MALQAPQRFTGLLGLKTGGPWIKFDPITIANLWRWWFQLVMAAPVIGRRMLAAPDPRHILRFARWVGGGALPWTDADVGIYLSRLRQPARAAAAVQLMRSFQVRGEVLSWMRGRYADQRPAVPTRLVHGHDDPVIRPQLLRGQPDHAEDMTIELVGGVGHWICEQAPELVAARADVLFGGR